METALLITPINYGNFKKIYVKIKIYLTGLNIDLF